MFEVKKYGSPWNMNKEGYFIPDAHINKVITPYREVVDDLVKAYLENAKEEIHSIYIRGTVARGNAVYGVSDLDSYAITYREVPAEKGQWVSVEEKSIAEKHPFITGVQIGLLPKFLFESNGAARYMRFVLKTQSACAYGQDLIPQMESFGLNKYVLNFDISYIETAIHKVLEAIHVNDSSDNVSLECHHLMKKIVRTGLSLVASEENVYSRDLGYCYEYFSKVFPNKSLEMKKAVEWTIHPTNNKNELEFYLHTFGSWLIERANEWLDIHNPSREFEMSLK